MHPSIRLVVPSPGRGADGAFVFDLVDVGVVGDAPCALIHFDSVLGFASSDFSTSGMAGSFSLDSDSLDFTASVVPEPAAAWLLLAGGACVLRITRQRARHRPAVRASHPTSARSST